MKIAIVVYSLKGGGAERVSSYVANSLAERGHEVTLVTDLGPETDQHKLDAGVRRAVIGTPTGGNQLRKATRLLHKVMKLRHVLVSAQPDIVVALTTRSNNLALLATVGTRLKVVICERNDPRSNAERPGDSSLRKLLYPRADLLIAQTETMAQVMRELFKVRRTAVIPNPSVVSTPSDKSPAREVPADYILAIGRLAPQKGFDVLIKAYAKSQAAKTLDLVIAGQGGSDIELATLAREQGVEARVKFLGYVDDPFPLVAHCRIFALSSLWEGFPNVLLEAMSFARPVISTILPSGAHDMIENGVTGLLVPPGDVDAMAAAIDQLAGDREAAEVMARRGPVAVEQYRLPEVMARWEAVLGEAAGIPIA